MDPSLYIGCLETNALAIVALLQAIDDDQARWRPSAEQWSALEVICHLYDEEREDFRARLDLTLHHPEVALPPIDPQGWVTERDYQGRDLGEMLTAWRAERGRSLAWLRGLESPDWQAPCSSPQLYGMLAGDFLAAWAGHDLLHLRQLVELQWGYQRAMALPHSPDYAGDW